MLVNLAATSRDNRRSVAMDSVGLSDGTCTDGFRHVLLGQNRENHNQRRPTTTKLAMEQAQRPLTSLGRLRIGESMVVSLHGTFDTASNIE
jgi:hypothetical protein